MSAGPSHPFLVSIVEQAQSYFGVRYDRPVVGFGCRTREEAIAEAARVVARLDAQPRPSLAVAAGVVAAPSTHRAEFRTGCDVCKVTGKKPGCKRKACPACGGLGSVAIDITTGEGR